MTSRNPRTTSMKLVVTGPYGAGKTTLIRSLSEITVISTERQVSDADGSVPGKGTTTVAMDFGRLSIDDSLILYLFGTPGQRRFDFMWEILADGMLGFIVMIDDSRADSVDEAKEILEFFTDIAKVPFIVAVNRIRSAPEQALKRARHMLHLDPDVRAVAVDARDRESVKACVLELLYAVLDDVEINIAAG